MAATTSGHYIASPAAGPNNHVGGPPPQPFLIPPRAAPGVTVVQQSGSGAQIHMTPSSIALLASSSPSGAVGSVNHNYVHVVQATTENHVTNGGMSSSPPLQAAAIASTTSTVQSLTSGSAQTAVRLPASSRAANVERFQRSASVDGGSGTERQAPTGNGRPSPATTPSNGESVNYRAPSVTSTVGTSCASGTACTSPQMANTATVLRHGELKSEVI